MKKIFTFLKIFFITLYRYFKECLHSGASSPSGAGASSPSGAGASSPSGSSSGGASSGTSGAGASTSRD